MTMADLPIFSPDTHPNLLKKIPLVEVFGPTIQGEGAMIGQQTYFLRFGLCDMACTMCDSMHAVDPIQVKANAKWLTQDQIFDVFTLLALEFPSTSWVTFSGGNPCIHDLSRLVARLKDVHFKIAVETQGTHYKDWLQNVDIVTVSPKGPGMGEQFDLAKFENFMQSMVSRRRDSRRISGQLILKVVIFDERDIEFAASLYNWCLGSFFPLENFYLSQGNPHPPGKTSGVRLGPTLHVDMLRREYLKTFDLLKSHQELSRLKFLPQFHVWLYSNKQGV